MKQDQTIGKPIFSTVLKDEMEKRGLTQEAVASAADASQATVNGWLSGSIPRADALYRLANRLSVTMEYLLTGQEIIGGMVMESLPPHASLEARRLIDELLEKARALDAELKKI
jgi:transcriptional regulator with XRE-family HTH domain